ncbi:MAG: hypothetical protein M1816_006984 [Peltula sp. TS41687]|nr:MAG: hypothetical protein M1816_006984 [Peltula sp. TS41687]
MPQSPTPADSLSAPGHRASALQNIFNEALVHTLKTISYDHFAACFPTPARACPDSLRAVWQQMVGRFEELARSEFDDILRERDVIRLLNELDTMVARAWKEKGSAGEGADDAVRPLAYVSQPFQSLLTLSSHTFASWGRILDADQSINGYSSSPHTLPPSAILSAHLAPYLVQQRSELDTRIQKTQVQNVELMETIKSQQQEIRSLLGSFEEGAVADLNGAAEELDGTVRMEQFSGEIDSMEDQLRRAKCP